MGNALSEGPRQHYHNGGGKALVDPRQFKVNQAKANALIEFASRVKDWPLLGEAVDAKIEEQAEFVGWWDERVGKGWGGDRSKNAERAFLPKDEAEAQTGISQPQVSRWRKSLENKEKYRTQIILSAYRKAGLEPEENHRAEGTGENEWFTPERYIIAAREVMGGIDLDPATNPAAQRTVQAERFFTRKDDGLTKEWRGRVWLNPPYAQPLIGQFISKLVEEIGAARTIEAITLTHNYTDTAWFHEAARSARLICFTKGRIRFEDADGETCAPTQGQAFCYFGTQHERFRHVFSAFGLVLAHA